jgi:PTH1 family peptidyl-tRNA hydrolase
MYLIAGLGNPGDKYTFTRHNIGFLIIDAMIKSHSVTSINNKNFQAIAYKSSSNIFVKPQTFMNNSGESIQKISHYYKIPNEKIIIIHDDIDLQFGALKFKIGGGHGGHNGLRSIDEHIGKDYIRVRIGIGKPELKEDVIHFVLSNFFKKELEVLLESFPHILQSIEALQTKPFNEVKSLFSQKRITL